MFLDHAECPCAVVRAGPIPGSAARQLPGLVENSGGTRCRKAPKHSELLLPSSVCIWSAEPLTKAPSLDYTSKHP